MFHFSRVSRRTRPDLAIDLGTANTRVIRRAEGVVFEEPTLCCYMDDGGTPRFQSAGSKVAGMVDRVPAGLQIRHPLARGVLQDIDAASAMLDYALTSVSGKKGLRRPSALIGIPADATKAEAGALHSAARDAGLGKVELVREPFLAALGADLSLGDARASMVIECGAGTTEIAVYSLNGLCLSRSVRQGGLALDAALAEFLHTRHHFLVGSQTAERLKRDLARSFASGPSQTATISIRGRDMHRARPGTLCLAASDFLPVFEKHVLPLVEAARAVLHDISPDLAADLFASDIVMTGGSACTGLFARKLAQESGVGVRLAKEESRCVSRGLAQLLDG